MHSIGVLITWDYGVDLRKKFEQAKAMELDCCQLCCWHPEMYNDEVAKQIRKDADEVGITITGFWAGWSAPTGEWNFQYGPQTLGLVPPAYRGIRLVELKKSADFALAMGVEDIITHVGFLPEVPSDPNYIGTVSALRDLGRYLKPRGQRLLFETGQETPVTLLRTIEEVATGNLAINLDTANLILYGKGNTCDAIDVFGKYVRNLHIKDGKYPINGYQLGVQTPLGEGVADIPRVIRKLEAIGYPGPWIIEREVSGEEEQIRDIIAARDMLREIEKTL